METLPLLLSLPQAGTPPASPAVSALPSCLSSSEHSLLPHAVPPSSAAGWDPARIARRIGFAVFGVPGTEANPTFLEEVRCCCAVRTAAVYRTALLLCTGLLRRQDWRIGRVWESLGQFGGHRSQPIFPPRWRGCAAVHCLCPPHCNQDSALRINVVHQCARICSTVQLVHSTPIRLSANTAGHCGLPQKERRHPDLQHRRHAGAHGSQRVWAAVPLPDCSL